MNLLLCTTSTNNQNFEVENLGIVPTTMPKFSTSKF